jgi:hypothetical protein
VRIQTDSAKRMKSTWGGRSNRSAGDIGYGIHEMKWRRVDSNLPTYLPTHLSIYLSNLINIPLTKWVCSMSPPVSYTMIIGGDMIMMIEDKIR